MKGSWIFACAAVAGVTVAVLTDMTAGQQDAPALQEENKRLRAQVADLRARVAVLLDQLEKMTANMTELQEMLKAEIARRVELPGEPDVTRKEKDRLKVALRRTEDALRRAQAEGERLAKVVRVLRAENEELRRALNDRGVGPPATTRPATQPTTRPATRDQN